MLREISRNARKMIRTPTLIEKQSHINWVGPVTAVEG